MRQALVFATRDIREKGGLTFAETAPVARFLDEDGGSGGAFDARGDDCRIRLEFSVGANAVLLEGRVEGVWRTPCSRCLSVHEVLFDEKIEETYPLTAGEIDAGEEVRQALILSVPERSLCRPACLGLCPRCGRDLNEGACLCARRI